MELRSVSTAKAELEEPVEAVEAADAPVVLERALAAPAADVPVPEEPLEELEDGALVVPLAETSSPTWPLSDAIVPLSGA